MARNAHMDGLPLAYCFPEKFAPFADDFFKTYKIDRNIGCPELKMTNLKPGPERLCRFCGRRRPFVSFRKNAHIIPELLNNRHLLSDFECDECNAFFGKYEDHLSKFLGLSRTLLSVKGKEKIPKFKSPDKKFEITSRVDPTLGIIVDALRSDGFNPSFSFDENTDTVTVTSKKHPYIPLYVYKAFLKIALSCLSEEQLKNYPLAFNFLRSDFPFGIGGGFTYIYRYTMAYTFCYEKPVAMIFKKRDPVAPLFSHIFLLFAMNNIYELPIPFNENDRHFYGRPVHFPWAPPLFGKEYSFPVSTIFTTTLDLSSQVTVRDDTDSFSFKTRLSDLQIAPYTNPETGETFPGGFDPSKIKGISFIRQLL